MTQLSLRAFRAIYCFVVLCLFTAQLAYARDYHVSIRGTGNGDLATPMSPNAFALVLYNANDGDVFHLSPGTYTPVYGTDGTVPANHRLRTFYIRKKVTIQSEPLPSLVVLSGDVGLSGNATDNCYHVVTIADNLNASTANYVLDGITISDGYANGGGANRSGAGIYIGRGAKLSFNQITVSQNKGIFNGIGIYVDENANVLFKKSTIKNNTLVGGSVWGGGLCAWTGAKVVMDSPTFSGNVAHHGGGCPPRAPRPNLLVPFSTTTRPLVGMGEQSTTMTAAPLT